jgi:hypothetical protein
MSSAADKVVNATTANDLKTSKRESLDQVKGVGKQPSSYNLIIRESRKRNAADPRVRITNANSDNRRLVCKLGKDGTKRSPAGRRQAGNGLGLCGEQPSPTKSNEHPGNSRFSVRKRYRTRLAYGRSKVVLTAYRGFKGSSGIVIRATLFGKARNHQEMKDCLPSRKTIQVG